MTGYDAVVLAGGAARRLGGADKPAVRVGGRALLDRVLAACAGAGRTVVVGPRRPTVRPVVWTREQPVGAGPVGALAAGLREVSAETVVVLSADLPFLTGGTVRELLVAVGAATGAAAAGASADASGAADVPVASGASGDAPDGALEGVVLADASGRDQPLVAAYRTEALRRELALLAARHGSLSGLPLRQLTAGLALGRMPHPMAGFDCDTWEDITAARSRIRDDDRVLDEWIAAVKAELGIELDVDTAALLDLAKEAAHGVARPAAPLTTFLVGYAAAQAGGGPEAVAAAARKAAKLAEQWAEESS